MGAAMTRTYFTWFCSCLKLKLFPGPSDWRDATTLSLIATATFALHVGWPNSLVVRGRRSLGLNLHGASQGARYWSSTDLPRIVNYQQFR